MINSIVGSIPEKVYYEIQAEEPVYTGGIVSYYYNDLNLNKEIFKRVVPLSYNRGSKNFKTLTVDNAPLENLRIVSLDYSEGARRFKCANSDMVFNMHEDSFIESMFSTGINKDGYLPGKYIWSLIRGSMKLIRVDSTIHKGIVEYQKRLKLKPISRKDLKVGKIYATKSNSKAIFLGKASTFEGYKIKGSKSFQIHSSKTNNNLLFYSLHKRDEVPKENLALDNAYLTKSHSFVTEIGEIDVSPSIIKDIRNHFINKIKDILVSVSSGNSQKYFGMWYSYRPQDLKDRLEREYLSMFKMIHISENKAENIPIFNIEKYLTLM